MAMPTPTWKTENDLCRCCHTEAEEDCSFLSISEPVYNLGSTEVFMDILKNCFDIDLLWVKGAETAMRICNTCVQQLRDANNFKKQVQRCEARFKEINYELLKDILPAQIKLESCFDDEVKQEFPVSSDSEDENDGFDINFDADNDDEKKLIEINVPVNTTESTNSKAQWKTLVIMKKSASKSPKKTSNEAEAKKTKVASLLNAPRNHSMFTMKPTDYERDGDYFICKHCGKKTKCRSHFTNHVKCDHYKLQKFMCPRCNEGFMNIDEFVTHKFFVHQIDDRSKCNSCDAVFNRKCQLDSHYRSFHKLGEKIKCEKCDFETYKPKSMYRHKIKHKTVRDHKCRFCGKTFLRKKTLICHEKIHTNDRSKMCDVCGQAFVQKASLNYHMAKYHPEVKF